jgi:hypothetical protein
MAPEAAQQSNTFPSYTEAEWAAIERTLPAQRTFWMGDIRFELEQIGRQFWAMRQQRLDRPSEDDHARLRLCIETLTRLKSPVLQRDLAPAYWRLWGWNALLEMYSGTGFQRTGDDHREIMYARVIYVWEKILGGRFTASRTGPLPRFLNAVLTPILGSEEMLGEDGLKAMLQREKDRREYSIREARRLAKKIWRGRRLVSHWYCSVIETVGVVCLPHFIRQNTLTSAALFHSVATCLELIIRYRPQTRRSSAKLGAERPNVTAFLREP